RKVSNLESSGSRILRNPNASPGRCQGSRRVSKFRDDEVGNDRHHFIIHYLKRVSFECGRRKEAAFGKYYPIGGYGYKDLGFLLKALASGEGAQHPFLNRSPDNVCLVKRDNLPREFVCEEVLL